MLNVSAFYLEKQKILARCQYQNKKAFFTDPIFSEGFDFIHVTCFFFHPFSKYDLYTKSSVTPDVEALKPYYQGLIDKFIPGVVKF